MLPMSNPDVHPGAVETQQMRVIAPVGVRILLAYSPILLTLNAEQSNIRLRLRIAFTLGGRAIQDQVDFSGFPPGLTGGS